MPMIRNQPKTFQRRIFRELNVTFAELSLTLIRQTLVLTCSLRVESLHLVCNSCGPIAILTGTSRKQVPSIKSGAWWSADITLSTFDNGGYN